MKYTPVRFHLDALMDDAGNLHDVKIDGQRVKSDREYIIFSAFPWSTEVEILANIAAISKGGKMIPALQNFVNELNIRFNGEAQSDGSIVAECFVCGSKVEYESVATPEKPRITGSLTVH